MYRATEIRSAMDALGATEILAILIHRNVEPDGYNVKFHTPSGLTQQVATMTRKAGTVVAPHYHKTILRQVKWTQEVLIVVHGQMVVNLFNPDHSFNQTVSVSPGDIICLVGGAHSIQFIEDTELIEVKQGPYSGKGDDKELLPAVRNSIGTREDFIQAAREHFQYRACNACGAQWGDGPNCAACGIPGTKAHTLPSCANCGKPIEDHGEAIRTNGACPHYVPPERSQKE